MSDQDFEAQVRWWWLLMGWLVAVFFVVDVFMSMRRGEQLPQWKASQRVGKHVFFDLALQWAVEEGVPVRQAKRVLERLFPAAERDVKGIQFQR